MKIRHCFVSNSSSSSFIIGIANATQAGRDDVGEALDVEKAEYNDWRGCHVIDLDGDYTDVRVFPKNDGTFRLVVDSFDDTEVSCTAVPGDKIVVLSGSGPDGDAAFSVYDDNGDWVDIDYDNIELGDFVKEDIEKFNLIRELGGQTAFGAGRNG